MAEPGIVSGSLVDTPSAAIQINATPFRNAALAKGRGKAAVASAIGQDVGGLLGDVAQKFQQNRNAQTLFKADYALRQTKQQFDDWQQTHPDPSTWGPQYEQMANQAVSGIMSDPSLGPDLKPQIMRMTQNWQQQTTGEVKTAAQLKHVRDTTTWAIQSSTLAAQQGQLDSAKAIIDHNTAVGGWDQQEADTRKAGLTGIAEKSQIANASQVDPYQTIQDLKSGKWGSISEDTRAAEIKRVQVVLNRQMTDAYENIRAQSDNGKIWTKDELNQLVAQHKIEASSVDTILHQQAGRIKQGDVDANTVKVHNMLLDIPLNSSDDDRLTATTKIHGSQEYQSLPEAVKKDFDEALKKTAGDAAKESPVERDIYQRMRDDPIANPSPKSYEEGIAALREHAKDPDTGAETTDYAISDPDIKKRFGADATRESAISHYQSEIEGGYTSQAAKLTKMRAWFSKYNAEHDGRGPTEDEAEAYRQSLNRPEVEAHTAAALGGGTVSSAKAMTAQDHAAYDWATSHPDDPRATLIIARIAGKSVP